MRRNHCQLLSTTTGGTRGGGDDANFTVHLCVRGDEMSPLILSLFFFFFFFQKNKSVWVCVSGQVRECMHTKAMQIRKLFPKRRFAREQPVDVPAGLSTLFPLLRG